MQCLSVCLSDGPKVYLHGSVCVCTLRPSLQPVGVATSDCFDIIYWVCVCVGGAHGLVIQFNSENELNTE